MAADTRRCGQGGTLLLVALLLVQFCLPPGFSAQAPTVDVGQLPAGWGPSVVGMWTRPTEYQESGRVGNTAVRPGGDSSAFETKETIVSEADLGIEYSSDQVLAGFAERASAGSCAPLKDGTPVAMKVEVSEGQFHGYPATVVTQICSYPSYAHRSDVYAQEEGLDMWEGGVTSMQRLTCVETTPGGPCTLIWEIMGAWVNAPFCLGENAERPVFDALVAQVDAWKTRWTITVAGQPAPPLPPERTLTIVGYDGTDTEHMPLSFVLRAEENGKPLANEPIQFRFLGQVMCLADKYGIWDGQKWQVVQGVNLAADENLWATTNAQGELTLRALLDFGRMNRSDVNLKLPCSVELWAAIAAQAGSQEEFVQQRTGVTIRHPVFVRQVYFWPSQDPSGKSKWTRTSLLVPNPYATHYQFVDPKYGNRWNEAGNYPFAAYPEAQEINKRVRITTPGGADRAFFVPPSFDKDYFYPLAGGSRILIDLGDSSSQGEYSARMLPGDGIAVELLWADGVSGLFAHRSPRSGAGPLGAYVTFGDGSNHSAQTSEEADWVRFAVSQGTDVLIKGGLVLGATWLGGPVAGAWTLMLVETYQTLSTVSELVDLGTSKKLIVFRSEAALTYDPDSTMTLYTFAGSPSVVDDAGREVFAGQGEAISFTYEGPVQPAVSMAAPAAALEMQAVLSQEAGPYGGALVYPVDALPAPPSDLSPELGSEGGAVRDPIGVVPPSNAGLLVPLLCGGGGGLLAIGLALAVRARSRKRSRSQEPAPDLLPARAQLSRPAPVREATGWQVLIVEGPATGQRYPLGPNTSLGRSKDNGIPLRDAQASRHHALFSQAGGGCRVQDLGSTNGTRVNGQRIAQAVAVQPGDRVQIGNTVLQILGPAGIEPATAEPLCPRCGQPVGEEVRFCRHCGQSLY